MESKSVSFGWKEKWEKKQEKGKNKYEQYLSQKIYGQEMQWLEALNTDGNSDWLN